MMVNLRGPRPIAQVIYRAVPLKDGTFAVEIDIPGTWPTKTAQSFFNRSRSRGLDREAGSGKHRKIIPRRHGPDA